MTRTLTRDLPSRPAVGELITVPDDDGRPLTIRVSSVEPGLVRGRVEGPDGDLVVVLVAQAGYVPGL